VVVAGAAGAPLPPATDSPRVPRRATPANVAGRKD
jgi:hypothetical protein